MEPMAQQRVLRLAHDHSDCQGGSVYVSLEDMQSGGNCGAHAIDLLLQLLRHDCLCISNVQMGEVDQDLQGEIGINA